MEITIKNLQRRIPVNPHRVKRTVATILCHEGVSQTILSLAFVTDPKIQSLNQKFRKRCHPTDVLAFDLRAGKIGASRKVKGIEGEIIISTETVFRNSKLYRTTPLQELNLCLIHGILHLLGYDDHGPREIRRMRRKEKELLSLISR